MNITKQTILILLFLGGLTAAGCQQMVVPKGGAQKGDVSATAGPSPSERENFPGGCLAVELDGKQTREGKKENNEQLWSGGEISPTPTMQFTMDQGVLGALKSVSLVIQPTRDGAVVEGDLYQYAGDKPLAPGVAIPLNAFSRVHDNQLQTDLKALPAGTYRFSLQVHGANHWDRQRIDVQVKK
ncbi:MAG: hypothetical protein JW849_11355 [Phycisphaerae bacterium]|nr:hypothetical protein [Phycisphaerae bacterium]